MSSGGRGGCKAVGSGEEDVTVGADDVPEECPMSVSPVAVRVTLRSAPTEGEATREGLVSKEEAEAEVEDAREASPRVS
jgi:hypothetical protein